MTRNLFGFLIGMIMCAISLLMLIPAAVDLADGHPDWTAFVFSSAVTGFFGVLLALTCRMSNPPPLTTKTAFLITVGSWIVVPAVSALPLLGVGLSYTDAFFETMSGLTTTGSSVLSGLDTMPRGILLWRALLTWLGGVGIVVMAILMLPLLRIGGMQLFLVESSNTSEKAVASTYDMVKTFLIVYVVLTASCAVLFNIFGMSAFDAICHSMPTLATAGFSTHDASFGYFNSAAIDWTAVIFMALGSFPFVIYIRALQGKTGSLFNNPEVRALVKVLFVSSLLMAIWLTFAKGMPFLYAFRMTAFNITSIVSTTGFANTDYLLWGPQVLGIFFMLTFMGGCTGSTAGGIKVYRFLLLFQMMSRHMKTRISPSRVVPIVYDGKPISTEILFSVMAFVTAYMAAFVVLSVLMTFVGVGLVESMSSVSTAMANVGPGITSEIGPVGNFSKMPDLAKWIMSLAMMLGRLELLVVLVLLTPDFWRR